MNHLAVGPTFLRALSHLLLFLLHRSGSLNSRSAVFRQRFGMTKFNDLPAELKLQILRLVPKTCRICLRYKAISFGFGTYSYHRCNSPHHGQLVPTMRAMHAVNKEWSIMTLEVVGSFIKSASAQGSALECLRIAHKDSSEGLKEDSTDRVGLALSAMIDEHSCMYLSLINWLERTCAYGSGDMFKICDYALPDPSQRLHEYGRFDWKVATIAKNIGIEVAKLMELARFWALLVSAQEAGLAASA